MQVKEEITPDERNYRVHDDRNKSLINKSLNELGAGRSILLDNSGKIIAGNGVYNEWGDKPIRVIETDGLELIALKRRDLSPDDPRRQQLAFADNHTSDTSTWDEDLLRSDWELLDLEKWEVDFSRFEIEATQESDDRLKNIKTLQDRFIVPPFSVLDTRQGYWQERKNLWHSLGIDSQETREDIEIVSKTGQGTQVYELRNKMRDILGRDPSWDEILKEAESRGYYIYSGASIFDPVLTEIVYRWFCPEDGKILDPFAGGSVRGIVASLLGRKYKGIDLRKEQCEANFRQSESVIPKDQPLCMPYWIVGDSSIVISHEMKPEFDFVFSCPPYHDLEKYSDDKADLSNMGYEEFKEVYAEIIEKSISKLKENRFACFVVSEIRDPKSGGFYKNFVSDTINAFEKAGARFYNEIILLNVAGSLPIRVTKQFNHSRKIGRIHQNVLVFFKGDPNKIQNEFGELDFSGINFQEVDN